jgi:hypothetical protein
MPTIEATRLIIPPKVNLLSPHIKLNALVDPTFQPPQSMPLASKERPGPLQVKLNPLLEPMLQQPQAIPLASKPPLGLIPANGPLQHVKSTKSSKGWPRIGSLLTPKTPVTDPTTEATTDPSLANNEGDQTSMTNLVPTTDICRNNPDGEHGDNNDDCLTELPEDIMDKIVGMDLDELREYEALHAQSKRLPAYLKAEVDDMYYEFERQLHILAIKHQLHATLLYTHIGQTN